MIRLALLFVVVLLPAPGWTQSIGIRSGEHEDFTRIVLEFDRRPDWQFGRVEGGYEFRTTVDGAVFDLARVYDFIPRKRIGELRDLGDGRLFLQVGCPCYADAFDLRGTQVVLDIKDGAVPATSQSFEQRLEAFSVSSNSAPGTAPGGGSPVGQTASVSLAGPSALQIDPRAVPLIGLAAASEPTGTSETLVAPPPGLPEDAPLKVLSLPVTFLPTGRVAGLNLAPSSPQIGGQVVSSESSFLAPLIPEPPSDRVRQTEAILLKQIGRAAAQGLLDADLSPTERAVEAATDPGVPEVAETTPEPETPVTPIDHLKVQTAIDRDGQAAAEQRTTLTRAGDACLPDNLFDIGSWGGATENGADLSLYRTGLIGEFDVANPDRVLALARHYIYLTFGAEAAALVRLYRAELARPGLLLTLAAIMDNGASMSTDHLIGQMGCDGNVALWAALAQPEFRPGQEVNTRAILATFSALPLHLRRHLGPALAERFLAHGDRDTAITLRNAIDRAAGPAGDGFEMLEARLDLDEGKIETATTKLERIVADDAEAAPDAIITLIEAQLSNGAAISERLIEITASLAFEQRGTAMGRALQQAEIRARAHGSDFDGAFDVLNGARERSELTEAEWRDLLVEIHSQLVENGSDTAFLRATLPSGRIVAALPVDLRRKTLGRFLDLGLSAPVREILGSAGVSQPREDRVLLARAALLDGDGEVAAGYLAELPGEHAARLRAEALAQQADHDAAAQAYAALNDSPSQLREAWRAGDWPQVAALGKDSRREIAAILSRQPTPPPNPDVARPEQPGLAASQALLDQSRAARDALDALLSELSIP